MLRVRWLVLSNWSDVAHNLLELTVHSAQVGGRHGATDAPGLPAGVGAPGAGLLGRFSVKTPAAASASWLTPCAPCVLVADPVPQAAEHPHLLHFGAGPLYAVAAVAVCCRRRCSWWCPVILPGSRVCHWLSSLPASRPSNLLAPATCMLQHACYLPHPPSNEGAAGCMALTIGGIPCK